MLSKAVVVSWFAILFGLQSPVFVKACSVCVGVAALSHQRTTAPATWALVAVAATQRLAEHHQPTVALVAHEFIKMRREQRRRQQQRQRKSFLVRRGWAAALQGTEDDAPDKQDDSEETAAATEQEKPTMTTAMIASIGFYKRFISPLLPPACRFLPTCSQYGVQAIEQFGPTKGIILTAWRLVRCSPLGGKGYDPPQWPPVKFTYSSY